MRRTIMLISKNYINSYFYILFLLTLVSCGSKNLLYNPAEVAYLSDQLKIPITLDDPHMALFAEVSLWLGVPYRYGENSTKGTDCSGFVGEIYKRVYGKTLERSSEGQAENNIKNIRKGGLRPGDLVFFNTSSRSKKINHVGIFLKNGYFIHASTSRGVIVSQLEEVYYQKSWKKGGRVK